MAEAEVISFVDLDGVQAVCGDSGGERLGGHLRELFGEGEDDHCVEARGCEQIEALGDRGDELEAGFGAKDAGGVGIEGDRDGFCAEGPCAVL